MSRTRSRHSRLRVAALVAAVIGLTAAACGSNANDKSGDNGGGGSSASPSSRSFILGSIEPMTGANILTEYIHGVEMAVKDINAAGGIDGKPVVLKEYDDQIDAQKTVAAARLAIADKVDAVIGMPSTIESNAATPMLQRAGIVILNAGVSTPIASQEQNADPLTFRIMTPMPELIYAESQYIINEIKPTSIGMMGLGIDYGQNALPQFKSEFEKAGIKVTSSNLYPYTATDVTSEVLAMKGSDAVLDWSYPNQETLGLKTVGQYGLGDKPYFGGPSSSIINARNAVPTALQNNLYGVQSCDPNTDSRSYVKEWAARYKSTYHEPADYSSPSVYDAVYVLKAAVEQAKSLNHQAIAKALGTLTYDKHTMCAPVYHVDDRHQLSHVAVEMSFKGGTPTQVKQYTAADLAGHGTVQP
jgi:branched-chain amino acid transport system substrate-binding protein